MSSAIFRRMVPLGAVLIVLGIGLAGVTGGAIRPRQEEAATPRLEGGAASMEELLDEFIEGLEAGDRGALSNLRVSEDEYRNVIVPGSVEPGEPPQILSEEASEYFYGVLHGKSQYNRNALLREFGGKKLEVKSYSFEKGEKQYADYKAHRRLEIEVVDEEGKSYELRTGSIAEVDGRFKFISYIRD